MLGRCLVKSLQLQMQRHGNNVYKNKLWKENNFKLLLCKCFHRPRLHCKVLPAKPGVCPHLKLLHSNRTLLSASRIIPVLQSGVRQPAESMCRYSLAFSQLPWSLLSRYLPVCTLCSGAVKRASGCMCFGDWEQGAAVCWWQRRLSIETACASCHFLLRRLVPCDPYFQVMGCFPRP